MDRFLRDYTDVYSCLIYGPNTPTAVPYNSSATPVALHIVITKDLVSPVYLSTCSALSSNHLSVLIDTQCRTSFPNTIDPGFKD